MANIGTVRLTDATKNRLNQFGKFQESYEQVIIKLLDAGEILLTVQQPDENLPDVAKRLTQLPAQNKLKDRSKNILRSSEPVSLPV